MTDAAKLRRYRSPVWDEPLVMEMGVPGRRGLVFSEAEDAVASAVGEAEALVPASMRRRAPPALPEMSEPDVLRHYLHLSQETMGMIGISLFGTCTMKYNPRVNEAVALREIAELHPHQDEETLQGILEVIHNFDLMLRELSGMDRFVFQAGEGRTPPTRMPASRAPTTPRAASSSSATRSSPPSRRIPAIRRPPPPPASRS